jgi:hypothetical protein
MITSIFTSRPSDKHESYFYSTVNCIKDPIAFVYLQIGPHIYSKACFPHDNITLTSNIMSLLGFKATFQSTHLTLEGLYCIEITNTPLALSTTHNRHTYFTLEFRVYISYYLDVTASPPLKRISSRDSEAEEDWTIRFGNWLREKLGNSAEDKILFPKLLPLRYGDPIRSYTS